MKTGSSSARLAPLPVSLLITLGLLPVIAITTGCGSSSTPPLRGNTSVTVLISSTANDQVTDFAAQLQTLTMTGRSGRTVTTLLSSQQPAEFMHINGGIEPLTTVSVPQDIYTLASIKLNGAEFECIGQVPGGGLGIADYSTINQGPTVNLPSPITVKGSSMALVLNLEVSQSVVFPTCWSPGFQGFSLTPTFTLAPIVSSSSPTNSGNGKVSGLNALIASVGTAGSALTLTIPGGVYGTRTLSASSNGTTVFQGVSGASALSPGMFLDMDGAIQPDGSLLATRIAVEDSSINDSTGPVMSVDNVVPNLLLYGRNELGSLLTGPNGQSGIYWDAPTFDFSQAMFKISGQFTNLENLPFVPIFNASNVVAGENVDVTSGNFSLRGGVYTRAHTITLLPQTIDGTVVASQPSGNFVDYTVSLASYDLFPTLAVQPGQTTRLRDPSQVEVYVDSNTQLLNAQSLAAGGAFRFYGLLFNDNGTLRMDCAQVNDGVSFTSAPSPSTGLQSGRISTIRRVGIDGLPEILTTWTHSL